MKIVVDWYIVGCGAGHSTVNDFDEAARAVVEACRAATGAMTAEEQSTALLGMVPALRFAMVTNGRQAVERGGEWEYSTPTVFVRMRLAE